MIHELSVCDGIFEVLEAQATARHFKNVKTVRLELGELAGIEPDTLRFCFDVVREGSLADEAQLEIIEVPGEVRCSSCGNSISAYHGFAACPKCGSRQLSITGGKHLRIKELEVE